MTKSKFDVLDTSTLIMESDCYSEDGCDHGDFSFAFNNRKFSNHRFLIPFPVESTPAPGCTKVSTRSEKIEAIHISSSILGARSRFFYKLFSNGQTRDSTQERATFRLKDPEIPAFMELLNFMYSNSLKVTTASAVLDVLKVADKFEVASCIRHCSRLLRNLTMTPECVLAYLDLPSTILTSKEFQPLTVAAKQFYAVHYKDITKYQDEILGLPLAGVEAIIASDDLQVKSEDAVYSFIKKWVWKQYPNAKDRRYIITTRLAKFIRFPYMTHQKLIQVLTSEDFDPEYAQNVVKEAISFKAKVPNKQRIHISYRSSNINNWCVERAYEYRPIKMVDFQKSRPHCVVYMDLKHDACVRLFPSGKVYSEVFYLGGRKFSLLAKCNDNCFGFYICMLEKKSVSFELEYEFAAMSKTSGEFVSRFKQIYTFTSKKEIGLRNLFAVLWSSFIEKDSVYFVDGVLHLRVELSKLSNNC